MALNTTLGYATFRNKKLEALVEGRPHLLIHNGKLYANMMARAKITHHELNASLRPAGCASMEEVHTAVLESNGSISVMPMKKETHAGPQP